MMGRSSRGRRNESARSTDAPGTPIAILSRGISRSSSRARTARILILFKRAQRRRGITCSVRIARKNLCAKKQRSQSKGITMLNRMIALFLEYIERERNFSLHTRISYARDLQQFQTFLDGQFPGAVEDPIELPNIPGLGV